MMMSHVYPLYCTWICVHGGACHQLHISGGSIHQKISPKTLNASSLIKKAHQCLFLFEEMEQSETSSPDSVYVESALIITYCIPAWDGNCTALERQSLRRVAETARCVMGSSLPSIESIYKHWGERATDVPRPNKVYAQVYTQVYNLKIWIYSVVK